MIEVVFAKSTEKVLVPSGQVASVHKGQHWPTTDQVVRLRPDLFTTDPRYGLLYTEAPPGYDGQLNELATPKGDIAPSEAPEAEGVAEHDDPDVEMATANPGEKRSVRRGRPRRAEVPL